MNQAPPTTTCPECRTLRAISEVARRERDATRIQLRGEVAHADRQRDRAEKAESMLRKALVRLGRETHRADTEAMRKWAEQGGPDPWLKSDNEWAEMGQAALARDWKGRGEMIAWMKPADVKPEDGHKYLVFYGSGQTDMAILHVSGKTLFEDGGERSSLVWSNLRWVYPLQNLSPLSENSSIAPDDLTERQHDILKYIRQRRDSDGFPPVIREIASHFEIRSPNGVVSHLKALRTKGYLRNPTDATYNRSRGLCLTARGEAACWKEGS